MTISNTSKIKECLSLRKSQTFFKKHNFFLKSWSVLYLFHKIFKCKYSALSTNLLNHLGVRLSKNADFKCFYALKKRKSSGHLGIGVKISCDTFEAKYFVEYWPWERSKIEGIGESRDTDDNTVCCNSCLRDFASYLCEPKIVDYHFRKECCLPPNHQTLLLLPGMYPEGNAG